MHPADSAVPHRDRSKIATGTVAWSMRIAVSGINAYRNSEIHAAFSETGLLELQTCTQQDPNSRKRCARVPSEQVHADCVKVAPHSDFPIDRC